MSDLCQIATDAIMRSYEQQHAAGSLRMECGRCTAEEYFLAVSQPLGEMKARAMGWRLDEATQKELCPACAAELHLSS